MSNMIGDLTMHMFQELELVLNGIDISACVEAMDKNATGGWKRDTEHETIFRSRISDIKPPICFILNPLASRSRYLFLEPIEPNRLIVANIVSRDNRNLSVRDYNTALGDFVNNVVAPADAAIGNKLRVEMSAGEFRLEEVIPTSIVDKLNQFLKVSNKGLGFPHPEEEDRWREFISECHRLRVSLDAEMLRQWLVEEHGWSEFAASERVAEFQFARGLLKTYDHRQAS